jgi:hypothetical protein
VCHALKESFAGYMQGIYARPLLTGIPVLLLANAMKAAGVSGRTWPQLIGMGAFTCAAFFVPATFTCITRDHRKLMIHAVLSRVLPDHGV